MAVTLDQIVPWGRSMSEYVRMFDLTPTDLAARILDCAGGPSSFNAEMTRSGRSVVSCDPLYRYSAEEISGRIEQTGPAVLAATRANLDRFVWDEIKSPEDLLRVRRAAMELFLGDLPGGLAQQRYIGAELPALPFADQQFQLALCSHFLFTYSDLLSIEFHVASIREMCRAAPEARVFPLMGQFGTGLSPHLHPVIATLRSENFVCEVKSVPYQYQKGGNQMLVVTRPAP